MTRTGERRLAVAGGVASELRRQREDPARQPFEELYVAPNAGDRGLALGAALYGCHVVLGGTERRPPAHDYLGRAHRPSRRSSPRSSTATDTDFEKSDDIATECAALIAKGRIIGWVQGGAEFGPRALGHRSILADPRTHESKERLDREIKRREWFRPYAPSVLEEYADEYFEMLGTSPYMLVAVNTRARGPRRGPGDRARRRQCPGPDRRRATQPAVPPPDLGFPGHHRRTARC